MSSVTVGLVFIVLLQFLYILYLTYAEQYVEWRRLRKIKQFGDYGEKLVSDYLDNLEDVFGVYHGLQSRFDRKTFEIDHLLLTHQGIILIETKNIRGKIVSKRDGWCQIKTSEKGKSYERDFKSPIAQVDRTKKIFEAMMLDNGLKIETLPLVVFSNHDADLQLGKERYPVLHLHELERHVDSLTAQVPLSTRQLREIQKLIDQSFNH
ncbi:MAG: hypothetical protein COB02_14255 [Candidatus Cloacimonadota bacterium]|nr:MAG: hypothetical protein COB02_14255 [Candidatus Cloacimonadota bacterium]